MDHSKITASNFPAKTFDAPKPDIDDTTVYLVEYRYDGSALNRRARVVLTDEYSAFEDIRKILAVQRFGSNKPDMVARIKVLSVELDD